MKPQKLLLIALSILLLFFVCRGTWMVKAAKLSYQIQATRDDDNLTFNEKIDQLQSELHQTKLLSETCLYVAGCTPHQKSNALRLVQLEEIKVAKVAAFQTVRNKALATYKRYKDSGGSKDTLAELASLKDQYESTKADALKAMEDTKLAFEVGDLPPELKAVFQAYV